jgi:hypothetical protein
MTQIEQAGCFKIGSKVYRGNGSKVLTITAMYREGLRTFAKLNAGCFYRLQELSLAGPNGDGVGA